jgi:hypothetical protein
MATSEARVVPLRTAVAMCAATAAVFFLGVFAAHAWEGRPGVETRSSFTVAGTVTLPPGETLRTLAFKFYQEVDGGVGRTCPASGMMIPAVEEQYTAPSFSAQVPYGDCGRDFFDGSNVWFELAVNGTPIAGRFQVNPVPYAQFANVAGSVGTPDCPVGYERDMSDPSFAEPRRLCKRRIENSLYMDEIVRIGRGPSAFWIDRYEPSVWGYPRGAITQYGLVNGDYRDNTASFFPPNGQSVFSNRMSAFSVRGVRPSRFITWFQANEACAMSGKRLVTGPEWLRAANNTPDDRTQCFFGVASDQPRETGNGRCRSDWGAEDMVGNLWEMTSEWYAGVGHTLSLEGRDAITINTSDASVVIPSRPTIRPSVVNDGVRPWPADYNQDGTYNINGFTNRLGNDPVAGLPSVALRGGAWYMDDRAGIFAMHLVIAPSAPDGFVGFRCVIPR